MRTRNSLRERIVRAETIESMAVIDAVEDLPAPRLLWVQAYDIGGNPTWWTIPESGYDTDCDDWFDGAAPAARVSTDYLPDWPMRLRWKTGTTKTARELKGSRIHDGNFDRLEGSL